MIKFLYILALLGITLQSIGKANVLFDLLSTQELVSQNRGIIQAQPYNSCKGLYCLNSQFDEEEEGSSSSPKLENKEDAQIYLHKDKLFLLTKLVAKLSTLCLSYITHRSPDPIFQPPEGCR